MSEANVDAFERAIGAYNRRDIDEFLDELDPEVRLQGVLQASLEGEAPVYRGHQGVRQWVRDIDEAMGSIRLEFPEVRDLGNRTLANGRMSARGNSSGAEIVAPFGCVVDWESGKATRIVSFLDHGEALKVAGLSE